jgi:hypothetical protein
LSLRHVTSRHVTSRHVTSRHVTSRHVTSRHVTSRHVTSRHVTLRYVTLRHVTSRHVTSRHVTSRHVTSRWSLCLMFASNRYQAQRTNLKPSTLLKCEINAPLYLFVFLKKKISNTAKRVFSDAQNSTKGPLSILAVFIVK